jgi:hypothetical protein
MFVKEKLTKLRDTMQLANSYGTLDANKQTPQSLLQESRQ